MQDEDEILEEAVEEAPEVEAVEEKPKKKAKKVTSDEPDVKEGEKTYAGWGYRLGADNEVEGRLFQLGKAGLPEGWVRIPGQVKRRGRPKGS